MIRPALLALLLAGCATAAVPPAPRPDPCIPPIALSDRDLMTPGSLSTIRHVNAELEARCRRARSTSEGDTPAR